MRIHSVVRNIVLHFTKEAWQDLRRPPLVQSSMDYIDHVIGLMRRTFVYYVPLRDLCFSLLPDIENTSNDRVHLL